MAKMPNQHGDKMKTAPKVGESKESLAGKLGAQLSNTMEAIKNLPPKDKQKLFGATVGIVTLVALTSNIRKKHKAKMEERKRGELASLKSSVGEKDEKDEELEEDKIITEGEDDLSDEETIEDKEVDVIGIKELKALTIAERVAYGVNMAVDKYRTSARHCWDWVDKVYSSMGCGRKVVYKNVSYEGRNCGETHASKGLMTKIASGDHIFYNNKNKSDAHGNHSCVFLEWIDKDNQIAKVASYNAKKDKSSFHTVNLKKKPVTYIAKPIESGKINIATLDYRRKKKEDKEAEVMAA